ncbi:MAG TPA: hypothetical protein VM142_04530 [Acidimicrobiales bacterium]|nr:hypothetical protein [Acidimicrobiales bacterium]
MTDPAVEKVLVQLAGLLNSAVDVGASAARVARTTAQQASVLEPAQLGEAVRNSATAAGNVLGLFVNGLRAATAAPAGGRPQTEASASGAPSGSPAAELPTVRAGSTLRVPLLVENREAVEMSGLDFTCRSVDRLVPGEGPGVGRHHVRFEPSTLTVASRDFEKLTVRVATAPDTAPGRYRATIVGGADVFSTTLEFNVLAAPSEDAGAGTQGSG